MLWRPLLPPLPDGSPLPECLKGTHHQWRTLKHSLIWISGILLSCHLLELAGSVTVCRWTWRALASYSEGALLTHPHWFASTHRLPDQNPEHVIAYPFPWHTFRRRIERRVMVCGRKSFFYTIIFSEYTSLYIVSATFRPLSFRVSVLAPEWL